MLKTVSTANGLVSPTFSGDVTLSNGNLVIGTSGKGIDFSATPGTGTSELLNDYEEGVWTPGYATWSTAPTTTVARYTKIGRQVTIALLAQNGVNSGGGQPITGLPFTSGASTSSGTLSRVDTATVTSLCIVINAASTISAITPVTFTGNYWALTITYFV
jgi:hypothetical protein